MRHSEHTVLHTGQQLQHISATALHYNFELEKEKKKTSPIIHVFIHNTINNTFVPAWTLILIATAVNEVLQQNRN